MHKIVLFIPEWVFLLFIFLPLFLVLGGYYPDYFTGTLLSMIGLMTGIFWMAGVSSYVDKALGKKEPDWLFLLLLLLISFSAVNEVYQNFSDRPLLYNTQWPFPVVSFVIDLIAALWLTIKVKKIFYERSWWFLYFEIVCYAVGVSTLTPEIKNHYRENPKILKDSGSDDQILD